MKDEERTAEELEAGIADGVKADSCHSVDAMMTDARPTPEELEARIAAGVKANLRFQRYGSFVNRFSTFLHDLELSNQLITLKSAVAQPIDVDQAGEGSKLFGCSVVPANDAVRSVKGFLGLSSVLNKFYIRDGYDALFDKIKECWKNPNKQRVTLIGNAGTGKSWFQVYVVRRLLLDPDGLKYIIRQVGKVIYIIDLMQSEGYIWQFKEIFPTVILDKVENAVYLYEPGEEKDQPPLGLQRMPSFATLSPHRIRIAEYRKTDYTELYFWPWSFSAMAAVANDSGQNLNDLSERYRKFGGIVRHVLAEDVNMPNNELEERLSTIDEDILWHKALNIDRQESGRNVSGYILCYNNENEGNDRFTKKVLEFTSSLVESKVEAILNVKPTRDKAQIVLKRLNDEAVDLSGKNLEAVVTELLSQGTSYNWESGKLGDENWSTFKATVRKVERSSKVSDVLQKPGHILVPIDTNFPLCDIVFTPSSLRDPIDVVQFTWQPSHPFTIRALYDLRVNRLDVEHDRCVKVYIVSPGKEEAYIKKKKIKFLKGSLDSVFKWSKNTGSVQPDVIKTMWENTQVHVIRPVEDWKTVLGNYITPSAI